MVDPLTDTLPDFSSPRPSHILGAVTQILRDAKASIDQSLAIDEEKLIQLLESEEETLERQWAPLRHLNAVAGTSAIRKTHDEVIRKVTDYHIWLNQHSGLNAALKRATAQPRFHNQPKELRTLIHHALRDFRLGGGDLATPEKDQFRQLSMEIADLGTQFEHNLQDYTDSYWIDITDPESLRGLSEGTLARLSEQAKDAGLIGYRVTLDLPTFHEIMTHAANRDLRREIYTAWVSRASEIDPKRCDFDNSHHINEILTKRYQQAAMLNFESYAAYALEDRMASSVQEVRHFLHSLVTQTQPLARKEFHELEVFAKDSGLEDRLAPWDVAYYSERLREKTHDVSDESLRPWFPLSRVIDGLFGIISELYGIEFKSIIAAIWDPSVQVFQLQDSGSKTLIGHLYLDLFARNLKRGGAWMDTVGHRFVTDEKTLHPIALLTANFSRPAVGQQALLTHDDVVTVCHELGHCLHHLLTEIGYPSVGGLNGVEWDAVEFPSQFHENFAWTHSGLRKMSGHVDTGAPLPDPTIEKIIGSRRFHAGLHLLRQLEFALFDLELHAVDPVSLGDDPAGSTLHSVRKRVRITPTIAEDRFPNSFSHIFAGGYAAGYYSYLWAEVMAHDAFSAFARDGIFSKTLGQRFRKEILAVGSSRPAAESYCAFRGRAPQQTALLDTYGLGNGVLIS